MSLADPKTLKNLLHTYNVHPAKYLGQNFLVDEQALQILVNASDLSKDDVIIEVGAGIGTITAELAVRAKKVVAVEKDKSLLPVLMETTKNCAGIKILNEDILALENTEDLKNYKLVGNIPYYLTAPLLRKFLEAENQPSLIVLMVQKEVAQRICADPPDMSILAISVQVYAKPEIIAYVPRTSFWPTPKVDSAILKITPMKNKLFLQKNFFPIVRAGFLSPRKQLLNTLADNLPLDREKTKNLLRSAGVDPTRRAETLSVDEWIRLSANML